MAKIKAASTVVARFLLSVIFLAGGINKIFHWHESEKILMNVFSDWQAYTDFSSSMQEFFASLVPWTPFFLIGATLLELIGGLLLLLGVREKWGAALLILFLIPTTILFHQFWFVEGAARELQQIMFLKNLAIIGGLIQVVLHGAQTTVKENAHGFSSSSLRLP